MIHATRSWPRPSRPSCSGPGKPPCSPPMSSSRPRSPPHPMCLCSSRGAFSHLVRRTRHRAASGDAGTGRTLPPGTTRIGSYQESGACGATAFFWRPGGPPCGGPELVFLRARQETLCDGRQDARTGPREAAALERFIFEESCRLKQAALLLARAREFLKERHILLPAEAALLRLVGEQKRRARERIAAKITGSLSSGVVKALICTRTQHIGLWRRGRWPPLEPPGHPSRRARRPPLPDVVRFVADYLHRVVVVARRGRVASWKRHSRRCGLSRAGRRCLDHTNRRRFTLFPSVRPCAVGLLGHPLGAGVPISTWSQR